MTPQYKTDAGTPASGAQLLLNPNGATPPTDAYVGAGDQLVFHVWNAVAGQTVLITWRLLLPDGTISINQQAVVPTSDRTRNLFTAPLAEGFLLSIVANIPVNGVSNRTYLSVKLALGTGSNFTLTQVLTSGYLSAQRFITWPNPQHENGSDGAGAIVSVTGTTPGAGAEISETVPAHALWRLKSFIFKLTASATVATRVTHFVVDDGSNVLINITCPTGVTASGNANYLVGDDTVSGNVSDGFGVVQFPYGIRLSSGFRMRTLTTALQAGDQYTAPQYEVEEWLFG